MTDGIVVERVRSQPQRDAKRVGLEAMAPTLRTGGGRLASTATAGDAASSRSESAIRFPDSRGNPGRTLTDYADSTNGGRLLPTPTVQDASNNGGPSQAKRNSLPLNAYAGGSLNPAWVEWLMGFPPGWVDLS